MDSLRTKYEHRKLRKLRESSIPRGSPVCSNRTSSNGCITALPNVEPVQRQAQQAAQDLVVPSSSPPSGHISQSKANGNATASAELWLRALEIVKKSEDWELFCKVVSRKTGAQMNEIDGQADPLAQVEGIKLQIKQLVETKAQAADNKVQTFLDGAMKTLQITKDLGSAVVAFNPYAALGWNVVQFMITVAITDHAVRKEACESLPKVGEWTSRYQTFATIYTRNGAVQITKTQCSDTLLEVYTALLMYQVNTVLCLYSKMTRIKHSCVGEANSRLRRALDDLSLKEERWRSLEPAISREITDHHFKELEGSIAQLDKISNAILEEVRMISSTVESQRYIEILNWVSPLQHEEAHRQPKRRPRPQTTDWLMNHQDYIRWNKDLVSSCLWLRGKPGSGKSCLVHAVIEDQLARCKTDQEEYQILYVYLDGTDKQRKDDIDHHEKILRSLVKQLAGSSFKSPPTKLLDVYEQQHRRGRLTEDQCLDLLTAFSDSSVELKIIVDGLDECTPAVQSNLVECLHRLTLRRPETIKILVACRHITALENLLTDLEPRTVDVPNYTEGAIRTMVESIVNESLQDRRLRFLYFVGTRELAPSVVKKVTERAGGMFRFVQIALDRLHRSRNAHLLEKRLEELSRMEELENLYDIEWEDAMADQNEVEKQLIITALNFLIYGFSYGIRENLKDESPLRHDQHILEACTFLLKGKLDEAFSIRDLVAMCPSFMEASTRASGDSQYPSQATLRICHFSINEYLVNQHADWFSPAAANAAIAKLCMRIFVELDIDTDFREHPPNWLAVYATLCWPQHVRLARSLPVQDDKHASMDPTLRTFLLDSDCSRSFHKWTALMKKFRENIVHASRGPFSNREDEIVVGVNPVLTHGLEEDLLISVSLATQPPSSLFARLYLGFGTENLKQPCGNIRATWMYRGTTVTPQTFAGSMGLLSAIATLKATGCSPNEQNDRGETSGHVLCSEGIIKQDREQASFSAVLRALVRAGLDLSLKDHNGNTCFFEALRKEYFDSEVFSIFQEQVFDLEAPEPEIRSDKTPLSERCVMHPLTFAIACIPRTRYRIRNLDILLSFYTKRHRNVEARRSLVRKAIYYNDYELVKLLFEKYGADPTMRDELGLVPFQLALVLAVERSRVSFKLFDLLAAVTLKPGYVPSAIDRCVGVAEIMLRGCSFETVRLHMRHVAPLTSRYSCWGQRAITIALLFNISHGKQIAEYFYSRGYENSGDSRVYQKWLGGELVDEDIGRCSQLWEYMGEDGKDAHEEDQTEEEEYWDAALGI